MHICVCVFVLWPPLLSFHSTCSYVYPAAELTWRTQRSTNWKASCVPCTVLPPTAWRHTHTLCLETNTHTRLMRSHRSAHYSSIHVCWAHYHKYRHDVRQHEWRDLNSWGAALLKKTAGSNERTHVRSAWYIWAGKVHYALLCFGRMDQVFEVWPCPHLPSVFSPTQKTSAAPQGQIKESIYTLCKDTSKLNAGSQRLGLGRTGRVFIVKLQRG